MRCHVRAVLTMLALLTASGARAELAGLGLDPNGNGYSLLYVEGGRVHRADCDRMSSTHDHDHCRLAPASAPETRFFPLLPTKFGVNFAYFEKDAQEAWVKLQQIDTRLFEVVTSQVPTEANPVTAAQVADAEHALEKCLLAITGLRDQIARLEAALAQNASDSADLEQLALDREQLIQAEADRQAAAASLLDLRQRYVQQRANESDANFRDLTALRQNQLDAYNAAKYLGSLELKDLTCAALMASRLRETGFVWEASCNLSTSVQDPALGGAMHRIGLAFDEAEVAARTYITAPVSGRRLTLDVPCAGSIEAVRCDYPQGSAQAHFEGELEIEGPNQLSTAIRLNVYGLVTVAWTAGQEPFREDFEPHGFLVRSGGGHWTFTLQPGMIVIGGDDPPGVARCSVTLRNPEGT